jgi:hypothetical protein
MRGLDRRGDVTRLLESVIAGAAGAAALTAVHQTARVATDQAPRMDVLGKRALRAIARQAGAPFSGSRDLERETMAGDLVANTAYYALIGAGRDEHVMARGLTLGLLAGIGALLLPRPMGLGDPPNAHNPVTQVMTVAWYVIGGITAAVVMRGMGRHGSHG